MLKRGSHRSLGRESGFTMIEVLVSVVLFAFGTLALVGLHGTAVRLSTDAQQRAEATFLADQLLARMMISDPAAATDFAHHPDGSVSCAPTGPASTHPMVLEWLQEVVATLPRAATSEQQVRITGTPANEVTIRLCWKNAATDAPHMLEVSNRVQWP